MLKFQSEKMKVYVIDNGGQWTHREWRVLKYLGTDAKIVGNSLPPSAINDADAIVLSGGAPSIFYEKNKLGKQEEYLEEVNVPMLGICVGAQIMAEHFNGKCGPAKFPEYGKTEIFIDEYDEIFAGLPDSFIAWESHNDEIKETGILVPLAHSKNCRYQAVKHPQKPIYGVQFHPEVEHTQYGSQIFKNFLEIAKR